MDELTIAKILAGCLPRLKTLEANMDEYEAQNPFENKYPLVERATYVGLECEIENVTRKNNPFYWSITKDGSLRNGGLEFITHPIKVTRVERALNELFTNVLEQGYKYSDRTSIHVHMNVRTLTVAQLKSLVLTYMVFERALFHWVGQDRDKNIYCVPLYDIQLTGGLISKLDDIRNFGWQKYTALNMKPILEKGTIEFRHLYGTDNVQKIITWINFLLSLKKYALRNDPLVVIERITNMNTISDYTVFLQEVFDFVSHELVYPNLHKDMSACISRIKSSCLLRYTSDFNPKLSKFLSTINGDEPIPVLKRTKKLNEPDLQALLNGIARDTVQVRPQPRGWEFMEPVFGADQLADAFTTQRG